LAACRARIGGEPAKAGGRGFSISSNRARTMPIKMITCPDCGLVLRVTRDATGSKLIYDVNDWQRRCKRLDHDDPAWCLVRHGTKPNEPPG
jgi:hypothetical protein